ncbi:hypothetical protein KAH81_01540 [bacterium]|nr:hypothetical protein [bacterium]
MTKNILSSIIRDRESFYDEVLKTDNNGILIIKMILGSLLLFSVYGISMGLYNSIPQAISAAIKVPVLFILSLIICSPALFIFNILLGSKLSLAQSLAMILSAFVMAGCILASFAPIVIFFMLIGSSYTFLRLLHIAIFTIAGLTSMKTLNDGLVYACEEHSVYPKQGVQIFKIWVIIFAFVGTQLAWNLRPFLGNKDLQFQLFRKQDGNFYSHFIRTFGDFVIGDKAKKETNVEKKASQFYSDEHLKEFEESGNIEKKIEDLNSENEDMQDAR